MDEQAPGDYGYDLAHEEVRRGKDADRPAGREPERKPVKDGRTDVGGDLSYDESHDF